MMAANWTAGQLKFMEWLATPRFLRTPPTEEMFSDTLGIESRTLRHWKKKPGFQDEVNKLAREGLGVKLPEIYGALIREAEKGSYQHIQLIMEMTGDYVKASRNYNESSGEIRLVVKNEGITSVPEHLPPITTTGNSGT